MSATVLPVGPTLFRTLTGNAFKNETRYPTPMVNMYLTLAASLLDVSLWQDQLQMGVVLWTAHNLTLDYLASRTARGVPGSASGPVSLKSLGPASVSFDTTVGSEEGAGTYNLTLYGKRFYHLTQLIGMGGAQLGGTCPPYTGFPGSAAWWDFGSVVT